MKSSVRVLALLAFLVSVQPSDVAAQLVPVTPDCDEWLSVNILNQFTPAATDCLGAFSGNDKQQEADVQAAIEAAWGGPATNLGDSPFSSIGNGPEGTIVFDPPLTGDYAFVLKASNQFSIYFFEGLDGLEDLVYVTDGVSVNGNDKAQGLSHGGAWRVGDATVPEPGTMLLLGTGLIGLGVTARRRREDEQA